MIEIAWTAPATYTVSQVVTAANLNTYLRDNMSDLDRRTTMISAIVAASQSTASATYVDLATVGPAVTFTVGSGGQCLAALYASQANNTASANTFTSFGISGATTGIATDPYALEFTSPVGNGGIRFGASWPVTALNPGSTTFTTKYRVDTNTGTWQNRLIIVTPLGS